MHRRVHVVDAYILLSITRLSSQLIATRSGHPGWGDGVQGLQTPRWAAGRASLPRPTRCFWDSI
eukprot:788634-Prorocentrum_minimum.AAC.1